MTDLELFEKLWAGMVEHPPGVKFEDGKWQIKASRQELFALFSQARNQALEDAATICHEYATQTVITSFQAHTARQLEKAIREKIDN